MQVWCSDEHTFWTCREMSHDLLANQISPSNIHASEAFWNGAPIIGSKGEFGVWLSWRTMNSIHCAIPRQKSSGCPFFHPTMGRCAVLKSQIDPRIRLRRLNKFCGIVRDFEKKTEGVRRDLTCRRDAGWIIFCQRDTGIPTVKPSRDTGSSAGLEPSILSEIHEK